MFAPEFTPMGVMCLTNFGGIEIELSHCGDGVRYRFNYGDLSEPVEAEIEYLPNPDYTGTENDTENDKEDGLYAAFMVNDTAYFLGDFMAI
jgi:hypothetical protein